MDRRILEGLEACRPASDDLQEPELSDAAKAVERDTEVREAYQRVQHWDAAVSKTLGELSVPEGLAERILDSLHVAETARAVPDQVASETVVELAPTAERVARRRAFAVAGLATAVMVAFFVGQWLRALATISLESLAEGWLEALDSNPATWQGMASAPQAYPLPSVITADPAGWRRIGPVATSRCVAYKITHAAAGAAVLFVARLSADDRLVDGLSTAPPAPQTTGSGKSIGCWRKGALVYVLVVNGNERSYRAFVSPSRTPLA